MQPDMWLWVYGKKVKWDIYRIQASNDPVSLWLVQLLDTRNHTVRFYCSALKPVFSLFKLLKLLLWKSPFKIFYTSPYVKLLPHHFDLPPVSIRADAFVFSMTDSWHCGWSTTGISHKLLGLSLLTMSALCGLTPNLFSARLLLLNQSFCQSSPDWKELWLFCFSFQLPETKPHKTA